MSVQGTTGAGDCLAAELAAGSVVPTAAETAVCLASLSTTHPAPLAPAPPPPSAPPPTKK
ncbi:hypothetical protein [Streptomyces sp. NPDC008139]|uniref:hypothetical protein n=1 Tax=Streptomyces sp. NPDC008139 TaxID=3364814 RepID=UPI0036E5A9BC